jgi:hypothetical protein
MGPKVTAAVAPQAIIFASRHRLYHLKSDFSASGAALAATAYDRSLGVGI